MTPTESPDTGKTATLAPPEHQVADFLEWSFRDFPIVRRGNPLLGIVRRLKLDPESPMRNMTSVEALRKVKEFMVAGSHKWSDYTDGRPCGNEDFMRAWDIARVPEGERPLYEAIQDATRDFVNFPCERAEVLPRYNFFLNVLVHLRKRIPASEDLFLSCNGISKALKAAGVHILSKRWVGEYIKWAVEDGYLEQTAKCIKNVKAARFKFHPVSRFAIQ